MFLKLVFISVRGQMQYPASFLMLFLGYFLGAFIDILGIWILFDRFKAVQGWTLFEVGLLYGIVQIGFALAEVFSRGFDTFTQMVKSGDFDRILLRPLNPLFQIAVVEVQVMRIGRLLQGLIILIWSLRGLAFSFFSFDTLIVVFSILGTAALFFGLFIIQATVSFWTIETLELMNITTYGGIQAGRYPMSIYDKPFRLIFTFVIPLACVVYYPMAILLKHEQTPFFFGLISPLAGFLFLYVSCQFWRLGIKRYCSTGN